ncbi:MAG: hypothetical protein RIR85_790, partial [Pseudomonadota bacterium]
QANVAAYQAPETIDIEYVVLQADTKDAKAYAEKADLFANMAYEQPDSLAPVANRLKLSVQTFKGVTRGGANALSADHPLNNPKVLAAIFTDDAIKNRRNIEALELSPGKLISARITAHNPQSAMPFNAVAPDVKKQVSLKMAQDLAIKIGQEKLQALQKNPADVAGFGAAKWVSRNKPTDLTGAAIDAVTSVDSTKLPAVVSAEATGGGLAIYRVTKIQQPSKADPKLRASQAQQIAQLGTQSEAATYFDSVRERAGVKQINQVK